MYVAEINGSLSYRRRARSGGLVRQGARHVFSDVVRQTARAFLDPGRGKKSAGKATITITNSFNKEKAKVKVAVNPVFDITLKPASSITKKAAWSKSTGTITEYWLPIRITNNSSDAIQIISGAGFLFDQHDVTHSLFLYDSLGQNLTLSVDATATGLDMVVDHLISDSNSVAVPAGEDVTIYAYYGKSNPAFTSDSSEVALGVVENGTGYLMVADFQGTVRSKTLSGE